MLPDFDTLVEEIISKRRELGWSQKKLARRIGVSQSLIAKMEQRRNIPNYRSIRKIYNILNKNIQSGRETAGDITNPEIVSVPPDTTQKNAMKKMRKENLPILLVEKGGKYLGIVKRKDLSLLSEDDDITEVMKDSFSILYEKSSINSVNRLLNTNDVLLVQKEGKIQGFITQKELVE